MALYQDYPWVSCNKFLDDLRDFALANGWVLDYQGSIGGWNGNVVHIHKGTSHFSLWVNADLHSINFIGCTTYSNSLGVNLQTNHSPELTFYDQMLGGGYSFASSGNSIYFRTTYDGKDYWGALATIVDKIGVWEGGIFIITTMGNQYSFINGGTSYNALQYTLSSWALGNTAGGPYSVMSNGTGMNFNPAPYNAGILPVPIPIYKRTVANNALFEPKGFMPGIYTASPGSCYIDKEQISIDGVPHLVASGWYLPYFLIKLEA